VNEIEVNVPIYSEPDEYELLVISNFSQKSPIEDIIDGSLYMTGHFQLPLVSLLLELF
jgi:hypothetical protein